MFDVQRITAANVIANIALANWGTSFISAGASARTNKRRPFNVSGGNAEGRLKSIATHDDARALLNRKSGELFRARTPAGFSLDTSRGVRGLKTDAEIQQPSQAH